MKTMIEAGELQQQIALALREELFDVPPTTLHDFSKIRAALARALKAARAPAKPTG